MTTKRQVILLLFAVSLTLMATNAFFVKQTIDYKSINRKLILQNDSLKGAIIELKGKTGNSQEPPMKFFSQDNTTYNK